MKKISRFPILTTVILAVLLLCVTGLADEPIHLTWWAYSDSGDAPAALNEVLARANAISAEKIGVTVDMQMKTASQVSLDLNTGEYYDMIFTCDWYNNFDTNAQRGYYYDITDLIRTEAPALYEAVDPWWDIGTIRDRIYGVPMLKDLGAEVFFRINSDYYEGEKGLTLPEEMDFADLEPLLKMYKEDHPTEYPLYLGYGGLLGMYQTHERIVGSYLVIPYNRAGTPDGTRIVPVWEDESYMEKLRYLHKWYELGYINPDAATTEDMPYSLRNPIRSGTAWTGYKGWSNPDVVGFNVKLVRFIGPNMSRSTQQGSLIAINAAASEERVKACLRYMELLYTDRTFRDVLAYGIEGRHFYYYKDTVIRTPLASDEYAMDNFVTGPAISASVVSANEQLLADPDQWKNVYEGYKNAHISDTQGFSFDADVMESERSVLGALWSNHLAELVTGTIDPDTTIARVREEMEKAGLSKLQEEAQRQLDEYLESRK
ncbi:MAG: ABC transporter substrate-binding protein [Clostridia bacterium]|nr:ABC transporter substrate-binding protein [Clostridia bacterium]